ncbi:hypothetical protein JCM3770_003100 [Rhodotorula araucariae]
MSTWAQRASAPTESPSDSDAIPTPSSLDQAAEAQPASSSSAPRPAAPSKASSSDNWRTNSRPHSSSQTAPAARARAASKGSASAPVAQDDDDEGWETVEKKDKAAGGPTFASRYNGKKTYVKDGKKGADARKSASTAGESGSASEGGAAPKGKAAAGRARTGSSADKVEKKDGSAPTRPSLRPTASWADDEENGLLPSPNFGASAAPVATEPSDAAVEGLTLPPSQATSPTEEKEQEEIEPPRPVKKAAPPPKVNVWSVRREQLSQAAEPTASTSSPAAEADAPTPGEVVAHDDAKKPADKPQKKQEQPRSNAPKEKKEKVAVNGGAAASAKSSASSSRNASVSGWSSTPASAVAKQAPLVVAGEDATSWPAPEDAVKQEEPKSKQPKEDKAEGQPTTGGKKKKGDKNKWIPIKADITVSAPTAGQKRTKAAKAAGAPAAGVAEKKGAQPSQPQAKGKVTAAAQSAKGAAPAQQGKAKKGVAASPNARTGPLDTSVDAEGVIRPFGGPSPIAGSAAPNAASASAKPTSTSTPSEANGSTPATPATSSANGSEPHPTHAQQPLSRQTPAFVPQPQQQFAGRGRGRGGAVRGRGGGRGGANGGGFNRHFQQQHAAALAAGYVPVPVELDANGNPIVDQFGYPVAAQQQSQQAAQGGFVDPRMLDPTRYWLLGQLEWWFSIDNLCRDLFLRQSMDAAGWISVPLIASFNRIKNLTSDVSIVVECMRMTPVLEVSPQGRFVRLAQTWPEWVLPNAQKNDDVEKDFEEARTEVQALHERKETERAAPEAEAKSAGDGPREESSKEDSSKVEPKGDEAPAAAETVSTSAADEPSGFNAAEAKGDGEASTADTPVVKKGTEPVARKEVLSPREAPRTFSPKATPAQPILDTVVASVTTGASASSA